MDINIKSRTAHTRPLDLPVLLCWQYGYLLAPATISKSWYCKRHFILSLFVVLSTYRLPSRITSKSSKYKFRQAQTLGTRIGQKVDLAWQHPLLTVLVYLGTMLPMLCPQLQRHYTAQYALSISRCLQAFNLQSSQFWMFVCCFNAFSKRELLIRFDSTNWINRSNKYHNCHGRLNSFS